MTKKRHFETLSVYQSHDILLQLDIFGKKEHSNNGIHSVLGGRGRGKERGRGG